MTLGRNSFFYVYFRSVVNRNCYSKSLASLIYLLRSVQKSDKILSSHFGQTFVGSRNCTCSGREKRFPQHELNENKNQNFVPQELRMNAFNILADIYTQLQQSTGYLIRP